MNKNLTVETLLKQANRLLIQKRYKQAILKCSRAASLHPNNTKICNIWGMALCCTHDLDNAALKFTRAIQIDPKGSQGYYQFGTAQYLLGNYEKAIEYFRKGSHLTQDQKIFLVWGMALHNQGKLGAALEHFIQMIEENPRDLRSYIGGCLVYYCEEKYSEAQELFERMLAVSNPTQSKAQIVSSISRDLEFSEKKMAVVKNPEQKEQYEKKIVALRFYLEKVQSEL